MTYLQKSGNKYHAESSTYNGTTYHSKLEAAYAQSLDLSLRAGEIAGWQRQVKIDLRVNGQHIANYYIDFVIEHLDGSREWVECKGLELPEWRMKWRILEATFNDHCLTPDDTLTVIKQSSWGPPQPRGKYPQRGLAR